MRRCPRCGAVKPVIEFYMRHSGPCAGLPAAYCIPCMKDQALSRQRQLKLDAITYKGGGCERCGYDRYVGALVFHHVDPTLKEFTISRVKSRTLSDEIKKELDKCLLLCANCHAETHASVPV